MEFILNLALESIEQVWLAWQHNWPYLALSVIIATLLKLYLSEDKISGFLNRKRGAGVLAATAAAVATPLCSCGTTAVVLGMMASKTTWAPVVAFMVSSPLSSPEGLVYSAGLFGWPFAVTFFLASIVLGLAGGWLAVIFENRGWLANQARLTSPPEPECGCSTSNQAPIRLDRTFELAAPALLLAEPAGAGCCLEFSPAQPAAACGCGTAGAAQNIIALGSITEGQALQQPDLPASRASSPSRIRLTAALRELYQNARYLLVMFTAFAFVGYFLNGLIPPSWIAAIFGSGKIYNVPLAATLGLPLYINSETALPLIRALIDAGMSQGAAMAFIIVGSGTSIGAISGALTIARWRVVALVVAVLWLGAVLSGLAFNLMLSLNWF